MPHDAAPRAWGSAVPGDAPFSGGWRPESALSDLLAASVDGAWTFRAVDRARADTGSIRAVSLHLTGFVTG